MTHRSYPDATVLDYACPGCGALSLTTCQERGADYAGRLTPGATYYVCTNEYCEWVGWFATADVGTRRRIQRQWREGEEGMSSP